MGYETDLKLFIDGVWKSGEGRDAHDVVNPVTASGIAEVPYATKADLEEALAASERAWPEWRSTDVEKRGAILHKAAALLRERADHIAATLTQEQGKILAEAKAEVLGIGAIVRLVRRGDQARLWPHPGPPRGPAEPGHPPAGRPDRDLHARGISRSICWPRRSAPRSPPAARSSRARRTKRPGCTTEMFRALADAGIPKGVAQLVHGDADLVSDDAHRLARKSARSASPARPMSASI